MSASIPAIRVAVIGVGSIAQSAHPLTLGALDESRARAVAEEWEVPVSGTELTENLLAGRPDVAVVGTLSGARSTAVRACPDAGAWVLCEKSPTLSLAEYDDIASHESAEGPFVMFVFQHRLGSAATHLRALAESRELEKALVGLCHTLLYRGGEHHSVSWRGAWVAGGGRPSEGRRIHQMDLLLSIVGQCRIVTAVVSTVDRAVQTEDVSLATARFDSGAVVSVVNSVSSPRGTSCLRFNLTDATVELEHLCGYTNLDWRWTPAPHLHDVEHIRSWSPQKDVSSSHLPQLRALMDSFGVRHRPLASGADGQRVLVFVAALYKFVFARKATQHSKFKPATGLAHRCSAAIST